MRWWVVPFRFEVSTVYQATFIRLFKFTFNKDDGEHLKNEQAEVKTKLRSTMLEDRLNALILLYFHKDIALDYDEIVNIYSRKHPRRMTFLNPMEEK